MVLLKLFIKGELDDKYNYIETLEYRDRTVKNMYQFYKLKQFNSDDFQLVKIDYRPEKDFLQVILADIDKAKWKFNYQEVADKK